MTPRQNPATTGWFTGRTRLVTIVSIIGVGLAGATAVSANIGILDSASDSPVGNASAAGDLVTPPTQVVDVYLPATTEPAAASTSTTATAATTAAPTAAPTITPTAAAGAVQQFAVDVAGTVGVAATDSGLRLDGVAPEPGWSWTLTQSDPGSLIVTMTNGSRTFEFGAASAPDGTIAASVSEPIAAAAPVAGVGGDDDHGDDDHADDDHDDDDHGDDGHADDDHDDDHEEYEGGEDDD